MDMRRDVFQAIADPTRRKILHLLSKEPLNLNSISDHFEISRPAISKHIKILSECGLVKIRQDGRERYCEPQLHKLKEVSNWAEQYSEFWEKRLDKLKILLKDEKKKNKTSK